jgi:hypothetical protein
MQEIQINCKNNKKIYMNREYIKYSNVMKAFFEDEDYDDEENEINNFELDNVDSEMMNLIISIYKLRENNNKIDSFIDKLSIDTKFNLLSSCHYLDIKFIENKLYNIIIKILNNKSKDELEKLFDIKLYI